jgi:hypothetical protein
MEQILGPVYLNFWSFLDYYLLNFTEDKQTGPRASEFWFSEAFGF